MIIASVIAEYNPFHNGHRYLLEKARQLTGADFLIVIMSGSFVQRGAPACLGREVRTRMALAGGADLVIGLPCYASVSSAAFFAGAAVSILDQLGCVDYLCFGCEDPQADLLQKTASLLLDEPDSYQQILKKDLSLGMNFPSARADAVKRLAGTDCARILEDPNNILAVEYIKALLSLNSSIRPLPIKRTGSSYHDEEAGCGYPSAAAVRRLIMQGKTGKIKHLLPTESFRLLFSTNDAAEADRDMLPDPAFLESDDFTDMLCLRLIENMDDLEEFCGVSPAFADRIRSMQPKMTSLSDLAQQLAARNFTGTGINRALFHILLNHRKNILSAWREDQYSGYIPLLVIRKNASAVLGSICPSAKVDLVIRTRDTDKIRGTARQIMKSDQLAEEIYRQIWQRKYGRATLPVLSRPFIRI